VITDRDLGEGWSVDFDDEGWGAGLDVTVCFPLHRMYLMNDTEIGPVHESAAFLGISAVVFSTG
jgi:hypothetical protein